MTRSGRFSSNDEPGQRQAALLAVHHLLAERAEDRIDEVADLVVDVVGEDPQRHPDLRRGQPGTRRVAHGVGQVLHQPAQLLVERGDRLGAGARSTGSPSRRMGRTDTAVQLTDGGRLSRWRGIKPDANDRFLLDAAHPGDGLQRVRRARRPSGARNAYQRPLGVRSRHGTGPSSSASGGSCASARNASTSAGVPSRAAIRLTGGKPSSEREAASRRAKPIGSQRTSACTGESSAAAPTRTTRPPEYARQVSKIERADSTGVRRLHAQPRDLQLRELLGVDEMGGTMRLGAWPCVLEPNSFAAKAYGATEISERHRHRYEFNCDYEKTLTDAGFRITGRTPDGVYVEIIEIPDHPWFVGCQFHPEFKSKPLAPHPLFAAFIRASVGNRQKRLGYPVEARTAEVHAESHARASDPASGSRASAASS